MIIIMTYITHNRYNIILIYYIIKQWGRSPVDLVRGEPLWMATAGERKVIEILEREEKKLRK